MSGVLVLKAEQDRKSLLSKISNGILIQYSSCGYFNTGELHKCLILHTDPYNCYILPYLAGSEQQWCNLVLEKYTSIFILFMVELTISLFTRFRTN